MTDRERDPEPLEDLPRHPTVVPKTRIVTDSRGESVAMIRVGGKEYPMVLVTNCEVCHSTCRPEIEDAILKSYSYRSIAKALPDDIRISHRAISAHAQNHLPQDEQVHRTRIEQRASAIGRDIENDEEMLADYRTFAEVGVQKAFQQLMSGEMNITAEHAIALINFLQKDEEKAGSQADAEAYVQSIQVMIAMVKAHVDEETFQAIGREITDSPIIRSLWGRQKRALEG